jgi:hypothetical protein
MAVLGYREIIPRVFSHKFGDKPTAERRFVVTVDEPTSTQTVINAVGIKLGDAHAEYPILKVANATATEQDRQHVEIAFSYEVIQGDPNPLARPDVWTFSTSGAEVPALYYFKGSGNGDIKPLTNSASEFVEGLTTLIGEVRATISWNRAQFPMDQAALVTNAVNDSAYLGGAKHHWQCTGISASQQTELVDGQEVKYWAGTTELVYREQGWNLWVPDVGYTYKKEGKRKRAYVEDRDGECVDSPKPVPLKEDGDIEENPDADVRRVERRVHPEVNFSSYFGTPPS